MWKVTIKGILAKKVRFLLTGVAVMLGVAFVSGTFVLTATISQTFDNLFSNIYQHTDAVVREKEAFSGNFGSGRGRVPDTLLPVVKSAKGVAQADGTVQGIAIIVDKHDKALGSNGRGAPTFGFAYIPDRDLSSIHVVEGRGPKTANEIVIDKASADTAGYKVGDTVPVITKAGRDTYHLTGIVKFGTADSALGATIVAFTPETAARVLATPGTFDSIEVKADPGVSQDEVVRNIQARLQEDPSAGNVEVLSGKAITQESQNNLKDNLSFFSTFLLVFGVVALLVGSFIIFNTFSIIVAQRGRELALLRAIGAGERQVLGSVLFEAVLVGHHRVDRRVLRRDPARGWPQSAAREPRLRHPCQLDRDPRLRGDLVVRDRSGGHDRGGGVPRAAGRAHPAGRCDARRLDRPVRLLPQEGCDRYPHHARRCRAPRGRSLRQRRPALGRRRHDSRVHRRRGARADDRGADQCSARRADPTDQRRARCPRPRQRHAEPEADVGDGGGAHDRRGARRAHHDLRRLGPRVGQRRTRPLHEGRLRHHQRRFRSGDDPGHR